MFHFLYEISMLNGRAIDIIYPETCRTSLDILMMGSGSLPRKRKKHLRTLIKKANENNHH